MRGVFFYVVMTHLWNTSPREICLALNLYNFHARCKSLLLLFSVHFIVMPIWFLLSSVCCFDADLFVVVCFSNVVIYPGFFHLRMGQKYYTWVNKWSQQVVLSSGRLVLCCVCAGSCHSDVVVGGDNLLPCLRWRIFIGSGGTNFFPKHELGVSVGSIQMWNQLSRSKE